MTEIFDSGANGLGDDYADNEVPNILKQADPHPKSVVLVLIKNYDDTHGLKYKVTGIVDENDPTNSAEELKAETVLASGAVYSFAVQLPYDYIKVEVKNETGGGAADSSCKIFTSKS